MDRGPPLGNCAPGRPFLWTLYTDTCRPRKERSMSCVVLRGLLTCRLPRRDGFVDTGALVHPSGSSGLTAKLATPHGGCRSETDWQSARQGPGTWVHEIAEDPGQGGSRTSVPSGDHVPQQAGCSDGQLRQQKHGLSLAEGPWPGGEKRPSLMGNALCPRPRISPGPRLPG